MSIRSMSNQIGFLWRRLGVSFEGVRAKPVKWCVLRIGRHVQCCPDREVIEGDTG
jgi:hypothetical protein